MYTSFVSCFARMGAVALTGIALVLPPALAEAGHRYGHKNYHQQHQHKSYKRHHHHGGGGDALAAGVAGVLIGTLITAPRPPVYVEPYPVYVQPEPVYVYPDPVYVEPAPVYASPYPAYEEYSEYGPVRRPLAEVGPSYGQPPLVDKTPWDGPNVVNFDESVGSVGPVAGGSAEPWSPAWYEYCRSRFRSFDDQSGTYMGYDGRRHFCVAR